MKLDNYLFTFFAASICTGIFIVFAMLYGFANIHSANEVITYVVLIALLNIDYLLYSKIKKEVNHMIELRS